MTGVKTCVIDGEMLLDGEYATGRAIAGSCLLRFIPTAGEYLVYKSKESVMLIHKSYINKKLTFTQKKLPKRICASYRKDLRLSKKSLDEELDQQGAYAVLLDNELNEVCRVPISIDENLGLNVDVARCNGRIVAIRINRKKTKKNNSGTRLPFLDGLVVKQYMPIINFRMSTPKEQTIEFFDDKDTLVKCRVSNTADLEKFLAKYPQVEEYVRRTSPVNIYVNGCMSRERNGRKIRLSGNAMIELKKVVDSMEPGATLQSFRKALKQHDEQLVAKRATEPIKSRIKYSRVEKYWNSNVKSKGLHSILVELTFSEECEIVKSFVEQNEEAIISIARDIIEKEMRLEVDAAKLIATRIIGRKDWIAVNFAPEQPKGEGP